jgi:hypothetical protein
MFSPGIWVERIEVELLWLFRPDALKTDGLPK